MTSMTRRKWDVLAETFEDEVCDILDADGAGVLTRLLRDANVPDEGAVLVDLGCGIGTFVRSFGPAFDRVIAVDWSREMVRRARVRCAALEHVRWMVGGMETAGPRIGPVGDVVTCLNVITGTDAALRERQWAGLAAATRPGGVTLVVVPSFESARTVETVKAERRERARARRSGRAPAARVRVDLAADGLLDNGGDRQKYYRRSEIVDAVRRHGFAAPTIRRVPYAWRDEGMRVPPTDRRRPWDWACLARRDDPADSRRRGESSPAHPSGS